MAKHPWNVLIVTKAIPLEIAVSRAEGMTQWAKCWLREHEHLSFDLQQSCDSWHSNTSP